LISQANETLSLPGNGLPQARSQLAAVSNSSYGYFGGGLTQPVGATRLNTVDRIDFSNETTSAPGNNLPQSRNSLAAVSSSSYGYFGGGYAGSGISASEVSTIDRIDFSNETTSAPGNGLSQAIYQLAAVSGGASYRIKGSRTYAYFGGGSDPGDVATIDRIDFSNETTSVPGNNLPQARRALAAVSNNSYGYFGGGYAPPFVNTIDRLDFSNETLSLPGNNLPQARYGLAALSSSSYGYFGGGFAPGFLVVATVDRIDFSNETLSLPGNGLPEARSALAALSSSSYGYFGGGLDPSAAPPFVATIDRLDFSNETLSLPGNNLPQARSGLVALSSSSYGYFGGGGAPSIFCTIDRIDFSNETLSLPGNNLPQARQNLAAVSSSSYGYFGGGLAPSNVCTIERLDFSNETLSLPGNGLPEARLNLAAVSN
jgi:hypothetical protein